MSVPNANTSTRFGQLGKQDNCQVAVSLSLANHHASLPVAWRLYLPKEWASDEERRRKVGVPEKIEFLTKPQIALEQIEAACEAGLPRGVVLMDAGYGCNTQLRAGVSALALTYVAGILPNTAVWTSDTEPLPPKKWSGRGRRAKRLRRDDGHKPISVEELALGLPRRAWRKITWREGSCERLSSRFARVRVRAAHRDYTLTEPRPEEWLLVEWPEGEEKPTKYWFSTLPKTIAFRKMVDIAKLRWRIERDYQELKQEVGLGHFEGRGWRGFHHHATLCIAAYGFLVSERETIPPQDLVPLRGAKNLPFPMVTDPDAPPLRTARHVPNSIATMRRRLVVALAGTLSRCIKSDAAFDNRGGADENPEVRADRLPNGARRNP